MTCAIPAPMRPAVERALIIAFGTTELESVTALGGGLSGAAIFRIRVGAIPYVLRLEGARDLFRDPHRWHRCMRTAADACIAPRVRYADPTDGVTIVDYVPERSLSLDYAGSPGDLIAEAAQTVRALHQAPAFPPLIDYLDGLDQLIGRFHASNLLPPEETRPLFSRYAGLRAAWRSDPADLVSSHNDLNPRNILYDGARLWFVDWESAFLADRYVDLACLANFLAAGPDEAEALLRVYLGRTPDALQRARLFLMRQANHVFYGVMFLGGVAAERPDLRLADGGLQAPPLAELHRDIGAGRLTLAGWEERLAYGRARLAEASANLASPAFADAAVRLAA